MILVSKLLEGDNYSTWSRAMRIALSAKNKIGFVAGSIKPPSSIDATFPLWQRCNDMVLSWHLNSIHPDIATSVIYAETSAEVWADLQERFSQGNDSRIYQIKQEIGEHRQGQQSISVYYTKLKALWDELSSYHQMVICTCGGLENLNKRDEKEKVMQFLMGLNENYGPVRGQILLMQPLPDTRRVYSLVLQQEKQIEVSLNRDSMNHHAMLADHKSQAPTYSFADQNNKTIQAHQVQKQTNTLHCSYCDQDYHSVERCYYLHGFPVGHKLHGKNPPNQRRSNANHAKSVKVTEAGAKPPSSNDGPRVTTEEYNQVMALLRKNKDGNSPHFANATEHHQDEVVLPLPHDLDIQPLPTPIGPNSVEPIHYDTANSHNNTTEPTTKLRTEPTTDPTEPTTLDHPIVQPPSPIPYLRRGERVKQPNTMLRDFHLYNMAMVAPSQSSSPSDKAHADGLADSEDHTEGVGFGDGVRGRGAAVAVQGGGAVPEGGGGDGGVDSVASAGSERVHGESQVEGAGDVERPDLPAKSSHQSGLSPLGQTQQSSSKGHNRNPRQETEDRKEEGPNHSMVVMGGCLWSSADRPTAVRRGSLSLSRGKVSSGVGGGWGRHVKKPLPA
ncbi:hypothetical protein RHSIM_Rhsim03G0044200 [Rhododendron simsii]|uniref:Retrotransposon Copia-like N-terminal domain-containing protein n=1 Tax=Rhododendron simsii TaxID=118357 RepID=A0A834LTZ0_RHOSS|nr:hypothetical protein RHSIM_Rhsim03G0044200 [Rhododendron simsii]